MSDYRTVVADPPWPYGSGAIPTSIKLDGTPGIKVDLEDKYPIMTIAAICALRVREHVATDAHLYLWTTNAFMVEAHEVARAWGFHPKTIITWVKTRHEDGEPSMKTGYYYRGATEHVLFAVRGSLRLMGPAASTAFLHPRLGHSAKPDVFFRMVEEQSPGPYLEMFARPLSPLFPKRDGWHTWGNEMGNDVDLAGAA